jgi:hypothetical protein
VRPEDFCNWLNGYLELEKPEIINKERIEMIKEHLGLALNSAKSSLDCLKENSFKIAYC